jgi:YHS domain-containing protein
MALFSEGERQALGHRLIDTLMAEDDSHAIEVIDAQRMITQVLVHEPATWVLGQRPAADPADPPRYLVRVTAPASWRKEMSGPAVEIVTGVLAETERAAGRDPERVRRKPHAVILVDGISEGGIGIHGRAMGSMDLMELVSRPYRDHPAARPAPDPPPGKLTDPVCGMSVDLDDSTLTLVHEGALYGFCHGMCRRAFADEHGVSLSR